MNYDISQLPLNTLTPMPGNPRKYSPKQLRKAVQVLRASGYIPPLVVDKDGAIVIGELFWRAARRMGLAEVPVLKVDHLNDGELRALRIAHERLPLDGEWDEAALKSEFELIFEQELDLTLTAFDLPEIEAIVFCEEAGASGQEVESLPEVPDNPMTNPGDLWILGQHRLLCADALDSASCDRLMPAQGADLVCTDPPYNVPVKGHVGGKGAIHHKEFLQASGEMSEEAFTDFLGIAAGNMIEHSRDGSLHYIFMDWRHLPELFRACQWQYDAFVNLAVWDKVHGGMGSFYRSQHELVTIFRNGSAPHRNNVALGRHGRNRTNVWSKPGLAGFSRDRQETLRLHPTVKPTDLIVDILLDASKPGDIVLDPFAGSGTTLLACEKVGRQARCIEIDPRYVDVALKRWMNETGGEPVHEETGLSYSKRKAGKGVV